ncbi:MAG: nucleotidyltransferase domain-containing protein [Candidatus Binatia bacterium]
MKEQAVQKRGALTPTEQHALQRFKTVLESMLADNLMFLRLFGSRAREEGTEESDLDVLIVLQEKSRALCRRIVAEALEIDLAYDTNLAPTILSVEEYQQNRDCHTPFYRNVERESLPL